MNLRNLSDTFLLQSTKDLVHKEREITLQVLHHLREVERRSLYATLSYSSLFEYAVKELKYSEGSAQRRISSMRLLKELPEIEEKVELGLLSLSALSQAQSFFRQEKTRIEDKKEVLSSLEGKSRREVERELVGRSSEPTKLFREILRPVSDTHTELKLLIEDKLLKEVEELRGLLAHAKPNASLKDLLSFAVEHTLKELRPKAPKERLPPPAAVKTVAVEMGKENPSRYIQAEVKRQVWQRDGGSCTYEHGGRKCTCKHALEFDHIIPFAVGGETTVENLRLRCHTHNQLAAVQSFGVKKIAQYVPRLR